MVDSPEGHGLATSASNAGAPLFFQRQRVDECLRNMNQQKMKQKKTEEAYQVLHFVATDKLSQFWD